MSKNLYNKANYLVRQAYFNQKKWLQTCKFQQELSSSPDFQQLPIHSAKKVLWNLDKAWKSFFAASTDWNVHPEKYFAQPRIPKYKPKNGQFQVTFKKSQISFSNGVLSLPQITGVQVKPRLVSPTTLISVRIIPKGVGYVLEIIYSKYVPSVPKQAPVHIVGIDIGLTNLITMVNNIGGDQIFVFWLHSSVVDSALLLTGVQGGFKVTQKTPKLPDSSSYKGKKQNPRPRRVLLDIGCDDPSLIKVLTQLGLEVELVWRHAADLLNYEIIEICTNQYIDILVSTNSQLLTPPEEWLTYLMPHRTRLFFPTLQLIQDSKALAQTIYERTFTRLKQKQAKKDRPLKLHRNPVNNVAGSLSNKIYSE